MFTREPESRRCHQAQFTYTSQINEKYIIGGERTVKFVCICDIKICLDGFILLNPTNVSERGFATHPLR